MTINRSTLLDLPLPVTGTEDGTWGDVTNNGLTQYLDIAIAGMVSLTSSDFTAGALTIDLTEGDSSATNIANTSAQYSAIKVSSLGENSTITAPASNRAYKVINADSTYSLTVKASGQTGVTFLPGTTGIVAFNGTDYEVLGVVGPASATDNAIPKFDGTTGQIIQGSGVTIDDSNNVSGVAQLNATTADLTNIEVTNIKAKDGTSAGSIADSTGVVTLASSVLTTTDINGGSVDGVTLGTNSAVTEAQIDNININGNTIVSSDTNGNINITPNGTGDLVLDGLKWPQADGSADYVLKTNGSGQLSWTAQTGGGGGGGTSVTVTQITATASQTDFSVTYTAGQLSVYLNGALLSSSDYTATNGTTVVLAAGAASGDIFTALAYDSATQITEGDTTVEVTDSGTGKIEFTVDNVEVADFTTGEVVFNETGANQDFRVEGDTDANLFFVDASTDRVGIGTNTPNTYGKFVTYSSGGYAAITTNGHINSYQLLDVQTAGGRFTGGSSQGVLGSIGIEQATNGAKGGYILFSTCASGSNTPTERASFTSNGYLRMASGSGGIQFNGDTAAANALDDYEEGTWTPTITSASYTASTATGTYTKIGRLVYCRFTLRFSAINSSSDSTCDFSGFPFTASGAAAGIVREDSTTGAVYLVYIANNSTSGTINSYSGVADNSARSLAINENYECTLTYIV